MSKLKVIITSTRPGRVGPVFGQWVLEKAVTHGGFETQLVDLKEVNLPLMDESNHPVKRQYEKPHTLAWSRLVDEADAFVFVVPEYNFAMPPAMLNAIDYLFHEWGYKPAAFVSYGGLSGGLRSVQMAKTVLTSVKVMPIPENVTFPFFSKQITDGRLAATDGQDQQATKMFDELLKWSKALEGLRHPT